MFLKDLQLVRYFVLRDCYLNYVEFLGKFCIVELQGILEK